MQGCFQLMNEKIEKKNRKKVQAELEFLWIIK